MSQRKKRKAAREAREECVRINERRGYGNGWWQVMAPLSHHQEASPYLQGALFTPFQQSMG